MAANPTLCGVDLNEFLGKYEFLRTAFDATGLKPEDLDAIAADHRNKTSDLTSAAQYVAAMLQRVDGVHSVKFRAKDPEHLVAKIIRKRIESPDRVISLETYETELTDLIGVRAFHLLKDQWKPISDFVRGKWPQYKDPVAYHRAGDPKEVVDAFTAAGLVAKQHPAGYRSVHHIIKWQPTVNVHLIEIQVRTLIEEAWSEIDHTVRYPRKTDDKELEGFLMLFNAYAGSADSMGTYVMGLRRRLVEHREKVEQLESRISSAESKLQETVSKLNISQTERDQLKKDVAELRSATETVANTTYLTPSTGVLHFSTSEYKGGVAGGVKIFNTARTCANGHTFEPGAFSLSQMMSGYPCPQCGAPTY
jgi:putative GTP pyrophosphokinase